LLALVKYLEFTSSQIEKPDAPAASALSKCLTTTPHKRPLNHLTKPPWVIERFASTKLSPSSPDPVAAVVVAVTAVAVAAVVAAAVAAAIGDSLIPLPIKRTISVCPEQGQAELSFFCPSAFLDSA
jgi:hypothetical protein